MADALSAVSLLVEGYGIENMSNSVVVGDNGRTKRATVVGVLALGLSVLMQVYYLVGGHLTPFLSIGIGFVISAGLYVAFMLLRHRCRAFFIIGVAGISISTINFAVNTFLVAQNFDPDFAGLFIIPGWLYLLSNLLSAAGLFSLSCFLSGVKKSFVIGVSVLWALLAGLSFFGFFGSWIGVAIGYGWCLSAILGIVTFFLILKTPKMSASHEKPIVEMSTAERPSVESAEDVGHVSKTVIAFGCMEMGGVCIGLMALAINAVLSLVFVTSTSSSVFMGSKDLTALISGSGVMAMLMLVLMYRMSACSALAGAVGLVLAAQQFGVAIVGKASFSLTTFAIQLFLLGIGFGALARCLGGKKKAIMIAAAVVQFVEVATLSLAINKVVEIDVSWLHLIADVVCLVAVVVFWLERKTIVRTIETRSQTNVPDYEHSRLSHLLLALGMTAGAVFLKACGIVEACSLALLVLSVYFFVKFLAPFVDRCIHGRMRRMKFFLICLCLCSPIAIAEGFLTEAAFNDGGLEASLFVTLLSQVVWGLTMFYFWVKRSHDIGWTSKFAIWMFILGAGGPIIGYVNESLGMLLIFLGIIPIPIMCLLLLFVPGTKGDNRFGGRK